MIPMNHSGRPHAARRYSMWLVATLVALVPVAAMTATRLTLDEAIREAIQLDPLIRMLQQDSSAIEFEAAAADQWQDPILQLDLANLPRDSFDLDQEPMTQIRLGVAQTLPRGQSLPLKQQAMSHQATSQAWRARLRAAELRQAVTLEWLAAWQAGQSLELIEGDRELFQYLVDVVTAQYASSLAEARQQDLIRAELELIRLDDRLAELAMQSDQALARLRARVWTPDEQGGVLQLNHGDFRARIERALDALPTGFEQDAEGDQARLAGWLSDHPALQVLDQAIAVRETEVDLVRQRYRPQWTLRASYGYREDARAGQDRPDFLSVGVSLDVPLFPSRRLDPHRDAAQARLGASQSSRWHQLRRMIGDLAAHRAQLRGQLARRDLYQKRLLKEIEQQASASLNAYTHDDGDFAEVVRARIDALNARIDALNIDVGILETLTRIGYYLPAIAAVIAGEDS